VGVGEGSTPRWTNKLSVGQKLGFELLLSAVNSFEVIPLQKFVKKLGIQCDTGGVNTRGCDWGTYGTCEGKKTYIQGFGKKT
jgi:hypothetical protein